jgi:hypothetical protein
MKMNQINNFDVLQRYNSPTLNIIATFKVTNKTMKFKNVLFENLIATIEFKTDEELSILNNFAHLRLFFIKLWYLGISQFTIYVITKNKENVGTNLFPSASLDGVISNIEDVRYGIVYLTYEDLIRTGKFEYSTDSDYTADSCYAYPSVFIFKDASWQEIASCFQQCGIIVSGGNPSERHILTKSMVLLSLFVFCLKKDNTLLPFYNNKLQDIFKYNFKDIKKYILPMVDFTSIEINRNSGTDINIFRKETVNENLIREVEKFFLKRILNKDLKLEDFETNIHSWIPLFVDYLTEELKENKNKVEELNLTISTAEKVIKIINSKELSEERNKQLDNIKNLIKLFIKSLEGASTSKNNTNNTAVPGKFSPSGKRSFHTTSILFRKC